MLKFYQVAFAFARRIRSVRRRRGCLCGSGSGWLSSVGFLAIAAIFLTGLGQGGSGSFVATVGAAEGQSSQRPRFGQIDPQHDRCLSRQEQRARIAAHAAIPLGKAVRAVKGRGDLLRARLCQRRGKLLYLVTVLGRSGKVQRFAIDAKTGRLVGSRH